MWPSLLVVLLGISPSAVADANPRAASRPAQATPVSELALPTLVPVQPGELPALPALPSAQPVAPAPQAVPAQPAQAADLARVTGREAAALAAIERERGQALAEKARLARQYESELQEIDRLKQQRASWRRDRLIRDRLRASHDTARALAAADQRVRRLDASLAAQRRRLVAAIDRELAAAPTAERQQALARWRAGAQQGQRRAVKKIVLPDDRMDPLADPEELEDQAALLRQSEAELAKELTRLEQQAGRYRYMATLSAKRERAAELGRLDDDQPRRTSVRTGTASAGGSDNGSDDGSGEVDGETPAPPSPPAPPDAPPPTSPAPPGEPPPDEDDGRGPEDPGDGDTGGLVGLDVVLADVVDTPTLDALRAADRSASPAVKARAAERASAQVRARLERLRAQRKRIQDRAQELRAE
jgi:hypothetical protein